MIGAERLLRGSEASGPSQIVIASTDRAFGVQDSDRGACEWCVDAKSIACASATVGIMVESQVFAVPMNTLVQYGQHIRTRLRQSQY